MSFGIFGNAKTYIVDLHLFNKLGLQPFSTDNKEPLFVGECEPYENTKVKIWVSCVPAQFWVFEVDTNEGKKYKIETGSGSMSDYWDTVLRFANGLLEVKEI